MKRKKINMVLMCAIAVMISVALPYIAHAAMVATDHPGYGPGEVVTIVGVGWQPGETVLLELFDSADLVNPYYTFINQPQADASGNFINTEYTIQLADEGRTFILRATGPSSGLAETTFYDAPHLHFFEDSSRTIPRDAFAWGATVYARADDLNSSPCWQIRWIDPNGVIEIHNLDSSLTNNRNDPFTIPALGPSGVWRAELYRPSNNNACGSSMTFSRRDTLFFDVAQIVLIGATDDAYVMKDFPNLNSNSGLIQFNLDVDSDPDDTERTFLRFNLPSLPGQVYSAKLRMLLFIPPTLLNPRTYDIHRVTGTWDVDAINWNNQPGVISSPSDSQQTHTGLPLLNNPMRWDVTSDVLDFAHFSFNNHGWRINDSAGDDPEGIFWATEANTLFSSKVFGPVLLIDTRPAHEVPTMTEWGMIIFIVLAGLGSVGFLRRQRKAKR